MSIGIPARPAASVLRDASWHEYVKLRDAPEMRNVRMTFDRGNLELMSPTKLHERLGYLIGRCIDVWTEEKSIPVQGCRATTFRRADLLRGLEPDNCYYIEHEPAVRERDELDLAIDPPPDLAVEVDVTNRSLDRFSIYAALGVPEVWRWSNEAVQILRLNPQRQYCEARESTALPGFPADRMVEMIGRRTTADETSLIREFRVVCRSI